MPIPIKPLDILSWFKEHPDWLGSGPGSLPWSELFRPGPQPWILDELLKADVMKDLSVLAVLVTVTEQLSAELRGPYMRAITSVINELQLPPGASVEFFESGIQKNARELQIKHK